MSSPFSVTISFDSYVFVNVELSMHDTLVNQLCEELSAYQIACERDVASVLVSYLELVIEKNKVLNLTRITTPRDAVTLHLVDSLLPLSMTGIEMSNDSSLLDMGTGAGFPGVPLMVFTGSKATLVDSVGKKVTAVNEFLQELSLTRGEAVHARLEELALRMPSTQTHVIARAVAKTNVLVEYATPFLEKDGVLIVEKGRPDDQELREAAAAAKLRKAVPGSLCTAFSAGFPQSHPDPSLRRPHFSAMLPDGIPRRCNSTSDI